MVIDSHALFWWLEGAGPLTPRAKGRIETSLETPGMGLVVSAVTIWEMRLKERRGLVEPTTPVEAWGGFLTAHEGFSLVATSAEIWFRAAELPWSHRDPADRIIAATALELGVPVLTKDGRFHRSDSPVEAVW